MTIGSSHQVKNQVRDSIEQGFDAMHRVADTVTFPLAAVDGAIHGVARGVLNWLTDTHPEDKTKKKKKCKPARPSPPAPNPHYIAPVPVPPDGYAQSYQYLCYYGNPPAPPPAPGVLTQPPPPKC